MEYQFKGNEDIIVVNVETDGPERFCATIDDRRREVVCRRISDYQLHLTVDGRQVTAFVAETPEGKAVMIEGRTWLLEDTAATQTRRRGARRDGPSQVSPPMPAVVTKLLVAEGDPVEKGQAVVVVSAMKMDTTLTAPFDGLVTRINVAEGDKVTPKQVLVDIAPTENEQSASAA
ncbi:MAG: biotin/lipoyl-binding protein [Deltaproteobacteria bacterium]|nr:biotin/lipoyl-binding protein [Deltaproteobacteria bacterium]